MGRQPKFDYDSDDFYDEILALAMQGLTDAEIADSLQYKFSASLSKSAFSAMKHGNYIGWNKEENENRSARLLEVLARGRRKINGIVRGRYLKAALGGIKVKGKTVTKRKLRIDGVYTNDEEISTTDSEQELAPNIQALATWLYHHDEEWQKEEHLQTDRTDVPVNVSSSVNIEVLIDGRMR